MKYLLFSLFALFSSVSAAYACTPGASRVIVEPKFAGYSFDRSLSAGRIAHVGSGPAFNNPNPKGRTVSNLRFGFDLSINARSSGGSFCGSVDEVRIDFGSREPIRVFIDSGIRPGSCEDRIVVEHELQHVAYIRSAIGAGQQRIETAVARFLRGRTFKGRSYNDAFGQAQHAIADVVKREATMIVADMDVKHAALDSYEASSGRISACRGRWR